MQEDTQHIVIRNICLCLRVVLLVGMAVNFVIDEIR